MNLLFLNIGTTELVLIILPLVCVYLYTIYHAINNPNLTTNERIIWILLTLIANGLGMLAYWIFGKKGTTNKSSL